MGDSLDTDPQWSCDVASNSDLTVLIHPCLPSEGLVSAFPSAHPMCPFLHQTPTGSTAPLGQQKREKEREIDGEEVGPGEGWSNCEQGLREEPAAHQG